VKIRIHCGPDDVTEPDIAAKMTMLMRNKERSQLKFMYGFSRMSFSMEICLTCSFNFHSLSTFWCASGAKSCKLVHGVYYVAQIVIVSQAEKY
jgi:hypothetical protein